MEYLQYILGSWFILIVLMWVLGFVVHIFALIDCIFAMKNLYYKIVWCMIILSVPYLGVLFYFLISTPQRNVIYKRHTYIIH